MKRLIALCLSVALSLDAAPAFSRERTFVQPDGSTFIGKVRGDEYLHWIETKDGDIVLYNKKTKRYESAQITADDLRPDGTMYRPGVKKARQLYRNDRHQAIYELWKKKRVKEWERRHGGIRN